MRDLLTCPSCSTTPRSARVAMGGALLALTLAFTSACSTPPAHEPPAEDGGTSAAVAVATVTVTDAEWPSTFEAGGVVRARTTATIAARVMAPVLTVTARPGDAVRRGATLVTLDAREFTAHAARGRSSVVAAEEAATAAAAQVAAAEAAVTLARVSFERVSGLHGKQSATAQELDQATAALKGAEAQLAGARAQALAANAARDAARAGADAADIGLSYTTLTAPFDGTVAARHVDPGTLAAPGMPLLVLEQKGPVRLEATLDEARSGSLRVGQGAEVRFDDGGDGAATWYAATVSEIGRIDPASHSFVVKLDLANDAAPRTGTFGRARFSGPPRRALTVPASSLVRRGQLAFVYVAEENTRARLRPVTPGPAAGDRVEVLAGLATGDTILLTPPASLRDGATITVSGAPRAAAEGVR